MTEQAKNVFPAVIIKILDDGREVVINRGSADGIAEKQRFLIYQVADELFDPETNKSLGKLEIIKGRGIAKHVQENMTTIRSDDVEHYDYQQNSFLGLGTKIEKTRTNPFKSPKELDLAKPI